jgi:hypothetical protein
MSGFMYMYPVHYREDWIIAKIKMTYAHKCTDQLNFSQSTLMCTLARIGYIYVSSLHPVSLSVAKNIPS